MPAQTEIYPSWRICPDQSGRVSLPEPVSRVGPCHPASQRRVRIRLAIENGNGHEVEELAPGSPFRHLHQIIRPNQPDKIGLPIALQTPDGIYSVLCTKCLFQIRDNQPRLSGDDRSGRCHARVERGHAMRRFQRILRGNQPPNLIQGKAAKGFQADRAVTVMRRVEGAPEQTDFFPGDRGKRLLRCCQLAQFGISVCR